MEKENNVDKTSNVIIGIMFIAVLFAVMILALVLIIGAVSKANTNINGVSYDQTAVASETGWANSSGYTLSTAGIYGFKNPSITSLSNRTDAKSAKGEKNGFLNGSGYTLVKSTTIVGFSTPIIAAVQNSSNNQTIDSGNYTLVGNNLINASATLWANITINYTWSNVLALTNATVSSVGVINNGSTVFWNNLSIGYTYQYDVTNTTGVDVGLNGIKDNTLLMIANFFALMPTVGTILAVVILVAGIVLLVLYVRRMKGEESSEGFQG